MKKKKLLTALTALCMGISSLFPGFRPMPVEASEQGDVRVATLISRRPEMQALRN